MATLAAVLGRFFHGEEGASAPAQTAGGGLKLPSFANDDIYFYVKRIVYSRVDRAADPVAGRVCWRVIGSVVATAGLLVLVLLPSAYGLIYGFRIQSLRAEAGRLATERASLELQEAQLLSPERMEELARIQQFVDPEPDRIVYLERGEGSLALNRAK
jgi:hypothetical protein